MNGVCSGIYNLFKQLGLPVGAQDSLCFPLIYFVFMLHGTEPSSES